MVETRECSEKALVAYGVRVLVTWISRDVILAISKSLIRRQQSEPLVMESDGDDVRDVGDNE
jgi:hypothetical protein